MDISSYQQDVPCPIKVMVVTFTLSIGGAERIIIDWALWCKQNGGIEPSIVVINRDYDATLVESLRSAGVTLYLLNRTPKSKSIVPFMRALFLLYRLRPRIVHAHSYSSSKIALILKLCLPTARMFTTVHNTGLARSFSGFYRRLTQATGSRFIAISEAVAQECRETRLPHLEPIYNGIYLERFHRVFRHRALGSKVKLICVARLYRKQKGQDVLLRAIKECTDSGLDVSCIFAGGKSSGCGDERNHLERMAADLDIADKVTFCLDRVDVECMLHDADIFVLPSRFEGLGLAAVEAMAAGLPVVVTNVDGLKEIVSDGVTGFIVPPEDPSALARKIAEVAKEPNLEKICAAAVARANTFSVDHMCERYYQAYLQAL
jgi:glycosyltransferase involved in cell wall biosynthesis